MWIIILIKLNILVLVYTSNLWQVTFSLILKIFIYGLHYLICNIIVKTKFQQKEIES